MEFKLGELFSGPGGIGYAAKTAAVFILIYLIFVIYTIMMEP